MPIGDASTQPTLADVREAARAIEGLVLHTPLLPVPRLAEVLGLQHGLYLKLDNFQRSRSFKERGASYAMSRLPEAARKTGVVTRSSGNFAQALALAGMRQGVPVTVVMPTQAPAVKVAGTKAFGARVVQHGTTHQEGLAQVQAIVAAEGLTFIPPFDDMHVMVGQGTAGLEIFADLPSLAHFYCPLGGGGLLGGCAIALKGSNAQVNVVGVEPETAADFATSWKSGIRTLGPAPTSIADGLLPPAVGEVNWPVLTEKVDAMEVVAEEAIVQAMRLLYEILGIIAEPSGAVSLAGFIKAHQRTEHQGDVVCMISGGNVDLARFHKLLGNNV